jgi:hypothetical protein
VSAQALAWPAAERAERLARACGDYAELQREVAVKQRGRRNYLSKTNNSSVPEFALTLLRPE